MKKRRTCPHETPDTSRNNLRRLPRRIYLVRVARSPLSLNVPPDAQAQLQFSRFLLKNREIYCSPNIQVLHDFFSFFFV